MTEKTPAKKHAIPTEALPVKKPAAEEPLAPKTNDNSLAITSMVLGVVSLTGFGFVLGIPAIILGAMALKRKQGERGLSITGLVTGIVSTIISLLFLIFIIFVVIWGANHPQEMQRQPHNLPSRDMQFESSRF